MKRYLFIFVILAFCGKVTAQSGVAKLIHKGLELMDSMAVKGIDRSYIDIPDRPERREDENVWRYFLNVFGQFNNNRYRHNGSKGYLNDWFVNTAIGIRL